MGEEKGEGREGEGREEGEGEEEEEGEALEGNGVDEDEKVLFYNVIFQDYDNFYQLIV